MSGSVPARHESRSADPVLAAIVVGAVLSVAAVLVTPAAVTAADVVIAVLRLIFVWLCWQVAVRPQIAPTARRFWRTLAASGLLFAMGNLLGLVSGFGRPSPSERILLGSSVLIAAAIALLGWGLLAYPLDVTGRARLRLRLDVAIVMCAFGLLAWHVLCEPDGVPPSDTAELTVTVLGCAMALVAVFAAVKLLISGSAPFTTGAGMALGAGVLLGAWGIVNMLNMRDGAAQRIEAALLASAFLLPVAARVQYLQMRTRPSGLTARPRRVYSRLPYVAVAVTQILLVFELWQEGLTVRGWGMVIGTVAVALLAMIRQNMALTDNRALQDQLQHEATHDHLTGLPNRALLNERARQFLEDPGRLSRYEAVLLLDLDDFKAVNDELGHQVGDQLLVLVADRLRQCVRPTDTVARLGGDEFVVLLTATTVAGAVATARRILDALSQPATIEGHQVSARASIGAAVGSGEQFDALLRDADLGMYQAKRDPAGVGLHVTDRTGDRRPPPAQVVEPS